MSYPRVTSIVRLRSKAVDSIQLPPIELKKLYRLIHALYTAWVVNDMPFSQFYHLLQRIQLGYREDGVISMLCELGKGRESIGSMYINISKIRGCTMDMTIWKSRYRERDKAICHSYGMGITVRTLEGKKAHRKWFGPYNYHRKYAETLANDVRKLVFELSYRAYNKEPFSCNVVL